MNKVVAEEVKNAYSDCHKYKAGERNLHFLSIEYVSLSEAVKIMQKYVPSYNNFKPELLWQLPKDVKVCIARECSVCVYVKFPPTISNQVAFELKDDMLVDELNVVKDNVVCLWWD